MSGQKGNLVPSCLRARQLVDQSKYRAVWHAPDRRPNGRTLSQNSEAKVSVLFPKN